ncbi:hypothetical protein H920_00985 [Fukomys damarensis]|uniref:Uncharacterized protein n=1 Tax=Fukomys damarensis TaxID=885580 RepID=A0A091E4F8_FUKDA|nr:hypothetical protein H920_00985 [Fukomys damarensis]
MLISSHGEEKEGKERHGKNEGWQGRDTLGEKEHRAGSPVLRKCGRHPVGDPELLKTYAR